MSILNQVLVTGATGLVGSHAVRAFLEAGHQVKAFVRSPEKAERVFGECSDSLEFVQGDIGDVGSVRAALARCNALVHSAAVVAFDSAKDPEALIDINVGGVRNVIGSALKMGIERVVHVSSVAPLMRSDGAPITESSAPQESKHPYSQSKTKAELYVRELQAAGHPVKIIYPGAVIGPNDPGLTESMRSIEIFLRQFLPITTTGVQYVDARDLATALVRLVEDQPGVGRYLAPGHFVTWRELASLLERVAGERPPARPVPASLLRIAGRLADAIRIVAPIEAPLSFESATLVTRWTPIEPSKDLERLGVSFRPLEESMDDAVRWMRSAGHL